MAKSKSIRSRPAIQARDRVSAATFPTGISYADRLVEVKGDYKRLAFLPFDTLVLEWSATRVPQDVRDHIVPDAARIQARRGEDYQVSSSGQTVRLGPSSGEAGKKTPAQLQREIDAAIGPRR